MTVAKTMSPAEWGLLLTLALPWGGSFFFVAVALAELPPSTLVACRVGVAALALLAVLALTGRRMPRSRVAWAGFFVMGALNNIVPFTLIVSAQTHIDSGLAAILNATTPLFTVLLAHLLTADEQLSCGRIAGVLLGLAGVTVLIGPAALRGLGADVAANVAVLAAAVSYACAGIFGRRFRSLSPLVAATGMLTASAVMAVPLALIVDGPRVPARPATWAAVAGLALASTALGYVIYFRLLATAGATNLLLVTFLNPVSALVLGTAVLGERPEAAAFTGMALIFAGLAAVDGRLLALARRRAAIRGSIPA